MKAFLATAGATLALLAPAVAHATANYVYHEQTTATVGGTCGPYLADPDPTPSETYDLEFKIEYQFYTNAANVYYTTDGSMPSGSYGVPSGTTSVLSAAYTCTFLDPLGSGLNDDTASASIPAQPAGTTVHYIVSAWYTPGSSSGPEVFANSGTCGACGTPCETSSCATVFTYTVAAPPDAGADGAIDSGRDAALDSGVDEGVDASLDASMDAPIDAMTDVGTDAPTDAPIDSGADVVTTDGPASETGADAAVDATQEASKDATASDGGPITMRTDAPRGGDATLSGESGTDNSPSGGGGCGCTTPGGTSGFASGAGALYALLFVAARRRSKRKGP